MDETSSGSTFSTDSASLIPLRDVVLGDVRLSAEKREEDSLSVETALEDGQRWEDYRFLEEYAQPMVEEEDAQPVFEERHARAVYAACV